MSTENEAAGAAEKETLTGDLSPGGMASAALEQLEGIAEAAAESDTPVTGRDLAVVLRLLLVYINAHDDQCVEAVEAKLENAVESLLVDVQALRDELQSDRRVLGTRIQDLERHVDTVLPAVLSVIEDRIARIEGAVGDLERAAKR